MAGLQNVRSPIIDHPLTLCWYPSLLLGGPSHCSKPELWIKSLAHWTDILRLQVRSAMLTYIFGGREVCLYQNKYFLWLKFGVFQVMLHTGLPPLLCVIMYNKLFIFFCLSGILLTMLFMERIGRKKTLAGEFFLVAASFSLMFICTGR